MGGKFRHGLLEKSLTKTRKKLENLSFSTLCRAFLSPGATRPQEPLLQGEAFSTPVEGQLCKENFRLIFRSLIRRANRPRAKVPLAVKPHLKERHGGGVEKRGGWKTSRMTPLPKGVLDPPSYGTFSTPLRCQFSVFSCTKSTTEQTRSSFGGVQKFSGESVLWYVFLPPYVFREGANREN